VSFPRRLAWGLGALVSLGLVCQLRCEPETTLATFNIRRFPERTTNFERVARLLAEADADLIAVQEISDAAAFDSVLADASIIGGRAYEALVSSCARRGRFFSTGIAYDRNTLRLIAARDYPELQTDGRGRCNQSSPPGVLGVFEAHDGERIAALAVHFSAHPYNFEKRKLQLGRTLQILESVEREFDAHAVVLGDFNTTGFRGEPDGEREFVEDAVEQAGFRLTTGELDCTEYYRPGDEGPFRPSLLDHVVLRDGDWEAEVLGMCAQLECEQVDEDMHPDFVRASDHCPVRVRGSW
jgi:endonuclease/exonuclease/phosphatase family metal-dependent hydrolase